MKKTKTQIYNWSRLARKGSQDQSYMILTSGQGSYYPKMRSGLSKGKLMCKWSRRMRRSEIGTQNRDKKLSKECTLKNSWPSFETPMQTNWIRLGDRFSTSKRRSVWNIRSSRSSMTQGSWINMSGWKCRNGGGERIKRLVKSMRILKAWSTKLSMKFKKRTKTVQKTAFCALKRPKAMHKPPWKK